MIAAFGKPINFPDVIPDNWGSIVVPDKPTLEGSTMVFVLEKQNPTMLEVMHIREAPGFVHDHKLAGFLVVDDDDDWAKPLLAERDKVKGPTVHPFIAFCKIENGKIVKVLKFCGWGVTLEETLSD